MYIYPSTHIHRLYEEAQRVRERQALRVEERTKAECTFKPKIKRSTSTTRQATPAAEGAEGEAEKPVPSFLTRAMEYKQKVGR